MGTESYDYDQALEASFMAEDQFQVFFDNMQRKGFVHVQDDSNGEQEYRLNAIAVGWYEVTVHNLMGKPQEKEFSQKWNEFFKFFQKFNFFPLRNLQNIVLPSMLKPSQDTGIMDPKIEGKNKRKTIPIGTNVPVPNQTVYPTSFVNNLVEQFGNQDAIYAFPCVCRHGNSLIDSHCDFDIPRESCIGFGSAAKAWANWGYGRHVSKEETIDMYSAIDMTLDKLEKQIKKSKQKIRERRSASKNRNRSILDEAETLREDETEGQVIVTNIDYKPMDVEEAVLQMDLIENNFLVFTNARSDQVNVLYRRKDGHYGLIQPSS